MKYVNLLLGLLVGSIAFAQPDLDFQTTDGGWVTGALSKSYTGIGSPATNVSVTLSGVTAGLQSNSPQAFSRGLQLAVNHTTNSACVTTTITFSPGIQGLTFRLLNVDRGAANGALYDFVDQVTVSGKNVGGNVTPSISTSGTVTNNSGLYSSISGNMITGTGDAPTANSDPGNKVTFADVVTEITITYCNDAAHTIANPGAQTITIEDLTWFAPLPVRFSDFQGKLVGDQVALAWETAWEENSDYFELERSSDAQEFIKIGRVPAAGYTTSKQRYSALDPQPLVGVNYYRLKQVDKGTDKSVAYSSIIAVVFNDINPALSLLGNPAEGEFIELAFRNIDPGTFRLQSIYGTEIPCLIQPKSSTSATLIPSQRLAPGAYTISAQSGMNRLVQKLIVQ